MNEKMQNFVGKVKSKLDKEAVTRIAILTVGVLAGTLVGDHLARKAIDEGPGPEYFEAVDEEEISETI